MKVDAFVNTDFWDMTWLHRRTRRIHLFHGVAGKYNLDTPLDLAPTIAAFDCLMFVNADRRDRYVSAGLVAPDGPQAALVGYPKVDCLVDGSLDRHGDRPRPRIESRGADGHLCTDVVSVRLPQHGRRRADRSPGRRRAASARQAARSLVRSRPARGRRHRLVRTARPLRIPPAGSRRSRTGWLSISRRRRRDGERPQLDRLRVHAARSPGGHHRLPRVDPSRGDQHGQGRTTARGSNPGGRCSDGRRRGGPIAACNQACCRRPGNGRRPISSIVPALPPTVPWRSSTN